MTETELLRQGIKTKTGRSFTRFSIKSILQNPVYLIADKDAYQYFVDNEAELFSPESDFDGVRGVLAYNRSDQEKGRATVYNPINEWIVSVGEHPGIISSNRWIRVQESLERNKSKSYHKSRGNEALLTGLLLAVSIPPLAPWWMVVLGTAFAVVIAKQLYGGLGHNPFNPAMIGYVVLLISFPVQMTSWLPSYEIAAHIPAFSDALQMIFTGHTAAGGDMASLRLGIDGVSQATPLDTFKTSLHAGHSVQQVLQLPVYGGVLAGLGWQWVNIAWLAGGLFLLWQKAIRWHIPVSFLVSLGLCATLGWIFSPQSLASPQMHLLSGATMLGAFFILTDPVTASTTNRGRLIFGALAGLLVWLIRSFGGYPDGVAFAVLLANITVPLIDYYTKQGVLKTVDGTCALDEVFKAIVEILGE